MPRTRKSPNRRKRHKKVLTRAKGFRGGRRRLFTTATDAVHKAYQHQYADRRRKKRDFRKLWIQRINAATREHGLSYNRFINGLTKANVEVDRKMLSEIAVSDPVAFVKFVEIAKENIDNQLQP
jgi:large subunit ribosomal protein L20